jgi:hypothetical protein
MSTISFIVLKLPRAIRGFGMMKSMMRAALTAAILIPGLGPASAQAGWVGPDSWAIYDQQFNNATPPDGPSVETSFSSGEGGGARREVWLNQDTRGNPVPDTWDIQAGATFSLAELIPGDPVVLSLTAILAFGDTGAPSVAASLFGTNGPLVESDFLDVHDPQSFASFPLPQIMDDPPVTQGVDITAFVEEISDRYTHLGIVFSSNGDNSGNLVDFDVRLGPTIFVPEPSSVVLAAIGLAGGLGALRLRRAVIQNGRRAS